MRRMASLTLVLPEVMFAIRVLSWLITWFVSCGGEEGFEFATLEA
jgi:hypothetical protein